MPVSAEPGPLATLGVNRLGQIVTASPQAADVLGREPHALHHLPFTATMSDECVHHFMQQLWRAFRRPGQLDSTDAVLIKEDGTRLAVVVYSRVPLKAEVCVLAIAPPSVTGSGLEDRQLFETLPQSLAWLDNEERVVACNPALCSLLGLTPGQLASRLVGTLFFDWSSEAAQKAALHQRSFRIHTVQRDGMLIPIEAHLFAVEPRMGERAYLLVGRDLRDQESLERRSLRVAELERQSVGRELHDAIGQNLVGIAFLADELASFEQTEPQTSSSKDRMEKMRKLAQLCRETCAVTRDLVRGLVPVGLTEGSLAAALRNLAGPCSSTHKVDCKARCENLSIADDDSAHLFRIAQESVTNALKHSHCTHIEILLCRREERIVLSVRDNGIGISGEDLQRFGTGLHSIRHRCRLIGAQLAIAQPSEGGTMVSVSLPIPQKALRPASHRTRRRV